MNDVKILVVEDDASSAIILEKILIKGGYEVTAVVNNGEAALKEIPARQPDIILMDISISGGMDGVETATRIKAHHDLPIIYMTGYSDEATIDRAKKTAPFAYILKPFREKEVTITIEMALYKSQLDQKIKESELRLSTTLDNLHDAVISTDKNGIINYLNPNAELLIGALKERVSGQSIENVLNIRNQITLKEIPDRHAFIFDDAKVIERNQPLVLISTSGQQRIVTLTTTATLDAEEFINGYVVVIRDITESFNAEKSKRLMAAALESLEDAVIIAEVDSEHKSPIIVSVNEAFHKITGYSAEASIGRSFSFLDGEKTDRCMLELAQRSLENGCSFEGENIQYRKNEKEFTAHWTISPVSNDTDQSSQLVFVLRDISKIRALEDNIRQSQKIEAIGRLAGGIAHDFNNLLSVINSYSELLSLKIGEDSPMAKYVQNIRTAGQRGASLVSQLMTFSRRERSSPVVIDLVEVTEETETMLRPIIREDIDLITDLPTSIHPVKADPGQIEQILVNLCVNARDAMPEGGTITIKVRNHEIEDKDLAETDSTDYMIPGQYVLITVDDTGTGIEENDMKHLFEPFFTTKDIGKGTGLGLSTVYGIMKQYGGYIDVSSVKNQGSRFSLYFPAVVEEKAEPASITHDTPSSIQRGSETILLVEDDETFADCISGLLSLHGYIVHSASDGSDAIERYRSQAGTIKVLIADIVLPKVSGREVATRFIEANPDLKVIFMTGYDDELDNFYNFPAESIIMQKPFSLNSILSKVRELLDNPRVGSSK